MKHFNWGLDIYFFGTLMTFIAGLITVIAYQNVIGTDLQGWGGEFLASMFMGIALLCLGQVLLLVAYILLLVGIIEMKSGRREFGRAHASNVNKAVLLAVLFVILFFLGTILSFAVVGLGVGDDPVALLDNLKSSAFLIGAIDIVRNVTLGLGLVFLIERLCSDGYWKLLWMAFIVTILVTVIAVAVSVASLHAVDVAGLSAEDLAQLSNLSTLAVGVLIIPIIMFLLCYRHAYIRIRDRELRPMTRAYAPRYPVPPGHQQYDYAPQVPDDEPFRMCPYCGGPVQPREVFCANCGTRLW